MIQVFLNLLSFGAILMGGLAVMFASIDDLKAATVLVLGALAGFAVIGAIKAVQTLSNKVRNTY